MEPEPVRGRRLRRAVERVPQRLLDPVEVHEARVRPAVAAIERVGRPVRVRVEAERVHQRPRPAARPVPGAEGAEEADRRGRDVALRLRLVVPARREPDADDLERGIDRLQGVVGGREIRPEGRRGRVRARRLELRAPERGLVRLVADHELPHLRVRAGDRRDVAREEAGRAEPGLDLPGRVRIDGENDPQPGVEGVRDRLVEQGLVLDHDGLARLEPHPDHGLPEPDRAHLPIQRRAAVGVVLRRVVVGAHVGGRGSRRSGQEREREGRCHRKSSHVFHPSRRSPRPRQQARTLDPLQDGVKQLSAPEPHGIVGRAARSPPPPPRSRRAPRPRPRSRRC